MNKKGTGTGHEYCMNTDALDVSAAFIDEEKSCVSLLGEE